MIAPGQPTDPAAESTRPLHDLANALTVVAGVATLVAAQLRNEGRDDLVGMLEELVGAVEWGGRALDALRSEVPPARLVAV